MPHKGYKQPEEVRIKRALAQTGKPHKNAKGWTHQGLRWIMDNGKERLEHRVIMERAIGRPLTSDEAVHHKNRNRLDNRIENLELMTRSAHTAMHDTGKSRKGMRKRGWTQEQRIMYAEALKKRRHPTAEENHIRSEKMKLYRAEHFWSTKSHKTTSRSG